MRLTVVQHNRLHIIQGVINRAFRRMVLRGRKRNLHRMSCFKQATPSAGYALDALFSDVSSRLKAPRILRAVDQESACLLASAVEYMYLGEASRAYLFRAIMADLYRNGTEYELLAQMPLAKHELAPRVPHNLAQSRAEHAAAKAAEWERKFKLAKTKLKKYRAKVARYTKQGVIV